MPERSIDADGIPNRAPDAGRPRAAGVLFIFGTDGGGCAAAAPAASRPPGPGGRHRPGRRSPWRTRRGRGGSHLHYRRHGVGRGADRSFVCRSDRGPHPPHGRQLPHHRRRAGVGAGACACSGGRSAGDAARRPRVVLGGAPGVRRHPGDHRYRYARPDPPAATRRPTPRGHPNHGGARPRSDRRGQGEPHLGIGRSRRHGGDRRAVVRSSQWAAARSRGSGRLRGEALAAHSTGGSRIRDHRPPAGRHGGCRCQ